MVSRRRLEKLQRLPRALGSWAREDVAASIAGVCVLQKFRDLTDEVALAGEDVKIILGDFATRMPTVKGERFKIEELDFLRMVGVPAQNLKSPWNWDGWNAGLVRKASQRMAQSQQRDPEKLLAAAVQSRFEHQQSLQEEIRQMEAEIHRLERLVVFGEAGKRSRWLLPEEQAVNKIMRYEAHLTRQYTQALHTLERLQKTRTGEHVPPPVALDVTVSAASEQPLLPALKSG